MVETECAIEVKGKTFSEIETQQAIRWFKENCCHAYEDDDSVFIEVNNEDYSYEIQISSSEVSYRAELYKEEKANA